MSVCEKLWTQQICQPGDRTGTEWFCYLRRRVVVQLNNGKHIWPELHLSTITVQCIDCMGFDSVVDLMMLGIQSICVATCEQTSTTRLIAIIYHPLSSSSDKRHTESNFKFSVHVGYGLHTYVFVRYEWVLDPETDFPSLDEIVDFHK